MMNKSQRFFRSIVSMTAVFVVFSFVFLASGVYAASTIGTNMSPTGTLTVTPATNSTTSIQFQNAASSTYFYADSTNSRIGVGGAPSTVFEVQGTASASYFFTTNTLQAGGTFAAASVAYSRFGIDTTGHSLAAADDVLFTGLVEFNDNAFFDAKASVSGNFQTEGRIRAGTASHSFTGDLVVTSNLILGTAAASNSSGLYTAEFSNPAVGTASFLFAGGGDSASTTGTCFQLKDNTGKWVYMSINGHASAPTINLGYVRCHAGD